jgi:hypothetical protein
MRLTKRRPAEPEASFADLLPPPLTETAVLRLGLSREAALEEADQQRIRAEMAEQDLDTARRTLSATETLLDELAGSNADLISALAAANMQTRQQRDDLGVRSLPSLADHLSEPFDEPIPDDAEGDWPDYIHGDRGVHYATYALVAETGTEPVEVDD